MGRGWVCLDVREQGASIGFGRRRVDAAETLPPPGGGIPGARTAPADRWAGWAPQAAEQVRSFAGRVGGSPAGLLVALPDSWFRIGLLQPKVAPSAARLDEYARWKVRTDWNLDEDDTLFDWQAASPRFSRNVSLLLVAGSRPLLETVAAVGSPAGLPVSLIVPRCIAAWNGWGRGGRGAARTLVLRDGDGFTFFGALPGRLAYFRSRVCEGAIECADEIAETVGHFHPKPGPAGEPEQTVWTESNSPDVMSGLLRHPLVSGWFA
jgi:hypothetical protein